jgi:hypothetical protein
MVWRFMYKQESASSIFYFVFLYICCPQCEPKVSSTHIAGTIIYFINDMSGTHLLCWQQIMAQNLDFSKVGTANDHQIKNTP